jgi:hypothetical protein
MASGDLTHRLTELQEKKEKFIKSTQKLVDIITEYLKMLNSNIGLEKLILQIRKTCTDAYHDSIDFTEYLSCVKKWIENDPYIMPHVIASYDEISRLDNIFNDNKLVQSEQFRSVVCFFIDEIEQKEKNVPNKSKYITNIYKERQRHRHRHRQHQQHRHQQRQQRQRSYINRRN